MTRTTYLARILLVLVASALLFAGGANVLADGKAPRVSLDPVAASPGHWDVTLLSASIDTIWVRTQIVSGNLILPCAFNPYCEIWDILFTVFPPVLGMRSATSPFWITTEIRDGGTYLYLPAVGNEIFHVALSPGQLYTFDGAFGHRTLPGCQIAQCSFSEALETSEFDARALKTEPSTWGKVKALYRK